MKGIRKAAKDTEGLEAAWIKSMEEPLKVLQDAFSRLSLKDDKFTINPAADQAAINDFLSSLVAIDAALTELGNDNVRANKPLATFMRGHAHISRYMISFKKCDDPACTVCGPVLLPQDVSEKLHHPPLPLRSKDPTRAGHFEDFDTLYGTKPIEILPALKKTEESAQGCQVKKVRDRVLCTDCGKWRCVYSNLGSAAFDEIRDSFERAVEDTMWSCGEPFENKEYRTNLKKTCSDAMESNYYSKEHWRHFPAVCCWCGSESNMAKEKRKAMLEEGYETVLPMCTLCDAINLAWQTRGKISQDRVSREKRAVAEAQAGSGPEVKRRKAPAKTVGQGEGNEAEKESL